MRAAAPCAAQGKRLVFVTNNSTKSRAGYLGKFTGLGLNVQAVRDATRQRRLRPARACEQRQQQRLKQQRLKQQQQQQASLQAVLKPAAACPACHALCAIRRRFTHRPTQQQRTWSLSTSRRRCTAAHALLIVLRLLALPATLHVRQPCVGQPCMQCKRAARDLNA